MNITYRKHQREYLDICNEIINGTAINTIYANVFPGGGKSYMPIISNKLLVHGYNLIVWVVPRLNLLYQGYEEYTKHDKTHRIAIGKWDSLTQSNTIKNAEIIIITYHAIMSTHYDDYMEMINTRNTILFLDEPHHLGESNSWETKMLPLISNAKLRIFASGTFKRGDNKKITGIVYDNGIPNFNSVNSRYIEYTREEAERERSIVPVDIRIFDYRSTWQEENVKFIEASTSEKNTRKSLFTALKTEYAYELLKNGMKEWEEYRETVYSKAKLLIVAANIKLAKEYYKYIKALKYKVHIATSGDSRQAIKNINEYKNNDVVNVLITVAMAYEGMSVNDITHIICLTHIRSIPWLLQLFSRGNRLGIKKVKAIVYGPGDRYFVEAKDAYINGLNNNLEVKEVKVKENSRRRERAKRMEKFQPLYSQILPENDKLELLKAIKDANNGSRYVTATQAQEILNIGKGALSYRLKAYGIEPILGYYEGKRERIIKVEELKKILFEKKSHREEGEDIQKQTDKSKWQQSFVNIETHIKAIKARKDWLSYVNNIKSEIIEKVIKKIGTNTRKMKVVTNYEARWQHNMLTGSMDRIVAIMCIIDIYVTFKIDNRTVNQLFDIHIYNGGNREYINRSELFRLLQSGEVPIDRPNTGTVFEDNSLPSESVE